LDNTAIQDIIDLIRQGDEQNDRRNRHQQQNQCVFDIGLTALGSRESRSKLADSLPHGKVLSFA
jgi:hypothetical protein